MHVVKKVEISEVDIYVPNTSNISLFFMHMVTNLTRQVCYFYSLKNKKKV